MSFRSDINNYLMYSFNNLNGDMLSNILTMLGAKILKSGTKKSVPRYHLNYLDNIRLDLFDDTSNLIKNMYEILRSYPQLTRQKIYNYIENNRDKIYVTYDTVDDFKMDSNMFRFNNWATFIEYVPEGIIVGYYSGEIFKGDTSLRSINSAIELRPDFRGLSLCVPFCTHTYRYIVDTFHVNYIVIHIVSEMKLKAATCYYKSAKNNELFVLDDQGRIIDSEEALVNYINSREEPVMFLKNLK